MAEHIGQYAAGRKQARVFCTAVVHYHSDFHPEMEDQKMETVWYDPQDHTVEDVLTEAARLWRQTLQTRKDGTYLHGAKLVGVMMDAYSPRMDVDIPVV